MSTGATHANVSVNVPRVIVRVDRPRTTVAAIVEVATSDEDQRP